MQHEWQFIKKPRMKKAYEEHRRPRLYRCLSCRQFSMFFPGLITPPEWRGGPPPDKSICLGAEMPSYGFLPVELTTAERTT